MNDFKVTPRSEAYINRGAETSDDDLPQSSDRTNRQPAKAAIDRRIPDDALEKDLVTRPSWTDAYTALEAIEKGKAFGNKWALYIRWRLQRHLFNLGCFIQKNAGKVLFVGVLLLSLCCVGLKTIKTETRIEELWAEDGGRLEKELHYINSTLGEGTGSSHEVLIQTNGNVLTADSLLLHYEALKLATEITVTIDGLTWSLDDICVKHTLMVDNEQISTLLETLSPCIIASVLDCFWEGGKLHDRQHATYVDILSLAFRWASTSPQDLMNLLPLDLYLYDTVKDMMDRAGITTGYVEKPCLNPMDKECPHTAPNKKSPHPPSVGEIVTGGCHGVATKFMYWPENLIMGGISRNKTGSISGAEAIQSIIELMGERDLFDFWTQTSRTGSSSWNVYAARRVLHEWQNKFKEEIESLKHRRNFSSNSLYPMASSAIVTLLEEFSTMNTMRVILGAILILVYVCLCLIRWSRPVFSQVGIGASGVLLQNLAVAAGLGISSVLGLHFNAATTQIVPFFSLALGLHNLFILARASNYVASISSIEFKEYTGVVLKQNGVPVVLVSLGNSVALFIAAIVPIPALRAFCLEAAILTMFSLVTNLMVFMALVSLDFHRRQQGRIDVFCCFSGANMYLQDDTNSATGSCSSQRQSNSSASSSLQTVTRSQCPPKEAPWERSAHYPSSRRSRRDSSPPPPYEIANRLQRAVSRTDPAGGHPHTVLESQTEFAARQPSHATSQRSSGFNELYPSMSSSPAQSAIEIDTGSTPGPSSTSSSRQCLAVEEEGSRQWIDCLHRLWARRKEWSVQWFVTTYWSSQLRKTPVKVIMLVIFALLLGFGILGSIRMRDGLEMTDVIPRGTVEYETMSTQAKYFGYYNIFINTKDLDYPSIQKELIQLHQAFQRVGRILKQSDGTIPDFWLITMRDWLLDVQKAFQRDWEAGLIHVDGWTDGASDLGILGYKLMIQTGDLMNPTDKNRVFTNKLVLDDNTINKAAFYVYLTVWYSNDAIAADASQPGFTPSPKSWLQTPAEANLKIPRSKPLTLARMPFHLHECGDSDNITETIKQIRDICDQFSGRGIEAFPSGVPFTYWEQYFNLRRTMGVGILSVLGFIFLELSIILLNPVIAFIVVFTSATTVVELMGIMSFLGLKMNAVPAVCLIITTGITLQYYVHIALRFLTNLGSNYERTHAALADVASSIIHGGMVMLLATIMLAFAEFDFIFKYFFQTLVAMTFISIMNGIFFLPLFLTMIGPTSEVVPANGEVFLSLPSPPPSPPVMQKQKVKTSRGKMPSSRPKRNAIRRIPSDISLTTISEEPSNISTSSAESVHHSQSQNVTVQPKFVVEATADHPPPDSPTDSEASCSSAASTPPPAPRRGVRTKVKATATINVEVHTPMSSTSDSKSKKRKRPPQDVQKSVKETSFTISDEKDSSNC